MARRPARWRDSLPTARLATAGTFREPVVILTESMQPDSGVSFVRQFSPLFNAWGDIRLNKQRLRDGQNADTYYTHYILIRARQDFVVSTTNLVLWERHLMRVIETQLVGDYREYLAIYASDRGIMDVTTNATIVDDTGDPILADNTGTTFLSSGGDSEALNAHNNVFWMGEGGPTAPPNDA